MIPLRLPATSEARDPYVARLRSAKDEAFDACWDAALLKSDAVSTLYVGNAGLLEIQGIPPSELDGDVVLADPHGRRVERLIRANSAHNTLLVTERCDQLCVMCSQPPKKTHVDRFELLTSAALLAPPNSVIGITGGEPTLYKVALFHMLQHVLARRPDLQFHVLTNGQHFEAPDIAELRAPEFKRVQWGVPLYAQSAELHDRIVGKPGAFARLQETFIHLIRAGANVELRTVLLTENADQLLSLAKYVVSRLSFIEAWSIMQLENIGFAKARWNDLYFDHSNSFGSIASALDHAALHGVHARLFNFARCTVPLEFRKYAAASISDWKRRYAKACDDCAERALCSGFFEWHPDPDSVGVRPL
jgi:His-Xaa-Ser system radical SAM maturase HxsC